MITKTILRKAIENKKHWVFELYYDSRPYPNVISGRYLSKRKATKCLNNCLNGESDFWGEV